MPASAGFARIPRTPGSVGSGALRPIVKRVSKYACGRRSSPWMSPARWKRPGASVRLGAGAYGVQLWRNFVEAEFTVAKGADMQNPQLSVLAVACAFRAAHCAGHSHARGISARFESGDGARDIGVDFVLRQLELAGKRVEGHFKAANGVEQHCDALLRHLVESPCRLRPKLRFLGSGKINQELAKRVRLRSVRNAD